MKPLRIAMVCPIVGDGFGMEKAVLDSARLLESAGHEISFLAAEKKGELPFEKVKTVPGLSSVFLTSSPRELKVKHFEALEFLEKVRPDIVHFSDQFDFRFVHRVAQRFPILLTAHTVSPSCPASTRYLENKGVCHYRSGWKCIQESKEHGCLGFLKNDAHRALAVANHFARRFSFKRFAHVAAISRFVKDTLVGDGWKESQIDLVYNAVNFKSDVRPYPDAPKNLFVIASRLTPLKGIESALEGFSKIKNKTWALWICGEGPLESSLKLKAQELGIADKVKFLGRVDHGTLQSLFKSATAVVQTNLGPEGFGLTVAEASAQGAPVIAYAVPALDELISSDTGILVPRANTDQLALAIVRAIDDNAFREKCRIHGPKQMVERFSPELHLKATLALYEKVLTA